MDYTTWKNAWQHEFLPTRLGLAVEPETPGGDVTLDTDGGSAVRSCSMSAGGFGDDSMMPSRT